MTRTTGSCSAPGYPPRTRLAPGRARAATAWLALALAPASLACTQAPALAPAPTPVAHAAPTPATAPEPASHAAAAPGDALATVNGVPIREAELRLRVKTELHDAPLTPERREHLLEAVIRDEVLAQRAVALGLDADPAFRASLEEAEARIAAVRRKSLAELFFQKEVAARARVSDDEARRYFDENAARIRTELHVWQILRRGEALIRRAQADLEAGKPFEEVALGAPLAAAEGKTPWDLGFLKWTQVPAEWQPVVASMRAGDVSDVIAGPNDRFWLIKLVEARVDPALTFEAVKDVLVDRLSSARLETLRESAQREARQAATIVYGAGAR